ncbi:MAG: FAD-binding protein [Lachnospiraceae bacterium]|nr:FAD-binding protein [Lachnospiraceae bacterium]
MKKQGITRRDFMKGAAVGAASVAAVGILGACSGQNETTTGAATTAAKATDMEATTAAKATDAASEAETTKAAPSGPVDGKYVTKAMGHEDWIYVQTTLRDGAITECKVLANEETMGIGNYACARIPAKIVETQSVEVPNIRGCSTTSMAIKNAVSEAIEMAGYDLKEFSKEIKRDVADAEITEECDVVIMGGGTAGLVAAARLIDLGKKVIVVEKRDIPGGSMAMTYGGVLNCGSEFVKKANAAYANGPQANAESYIDLWLGERFAYLFHDEYDRFNHQAPYLQSWFKSSGPMVDWMNGIGIGFNTVGTFEKGTGYGTTLYLAPGCYEGGAGYAMMFLANRVTETGNILHYNTSVTELIQDADGRVTGVKAETTESDTGKEKYTINAKAVLLASGGFQKNVEMLEQYSPSVADQFFNCASCSTGDGIRLGMAAGGVVECGDDRPLPAYLSSAQRKFELAFIHYSTPGLMVNVKGDQFGNILSQNHQTMAAAKLDENNGDVFYYVFDEAGEYPTRDYDEYGFDGYNAIFESGECVHYDSVEECAEKCNLPNLAATIEKNNEVALAGEKDEWGRQCPYLDTRNGIWAIQVDPTYYLTTAGLQIDPQAHVTKGGYETGTYDVIPGLYAAGDVCGSVEEKDGKQYGMGFDCAMTYGYIAAETIAAEI